VRGCDRDDQRRDVRAPNAPPAACDPPQLHTNHCMVVCAATVPAHAHVRAHRYDKESKGGLSW
jgi:hypothetical protein